MKSGWLAADKLMPGGSVNVTFAVDLPGVNVSNNRTQPYSFNLLFTGGQDSTASTVGSSTSAITLHSKVPDWKYGKAVVTRWGRNPGSPGFSNNFAIGELAPDGTVNLALPAPAPQDLDPWLQGYGCTTDGTFTSPNMRVADLSMTLYTPEGDLLGTLRKRRSPASGWQVSRLYTDSAALLRGTLSCDYGSGNVAHSDLDLNLQQGWNMVQRRINAQGVTEVRLLAPGTVTQLNFTLATAGVYFGFPDLPWYPTPIVLTGGSLETRAMFFQNGAISGEVTLETDVPGLTIEPGTITLPSLTAQGLTAQALTRNITFRAADDAPEFSGYANIIVKQAGVEVGRRGQDMRILRPYVSTYVSNFGYTSDLRRGADAPLGCI